MLSEIMVMKLNNQVALEFYSSNLYLQMSSWCESKALENCSEFLRAHSQEEMGHMFRLFDYINETGAQAVLQAIEAPPHEFKDIAELFDVIYEHEQHVTAKINDLAAAAFEGKDFSTFNFLQWYVAEQHEEEKLFKTILDKIEIIGAEGRGLYYIDMEIGKLAKAKMGMPAPADQPKEL